MIIKKWEVHGENEIIHITLDSDNITITIEEIDDGRQLSFFPTKENIKELIQVLSEIKND